MKSIFFFLSIIALFNSVSAQQLKYSFFVAGHAYGSVDDVPDPGMHPPFVDYFDEINAYPGMSFGVLTGDVVNYSNADYWNAYEEQITGLNDTVYIAAGNHDYGSEFENRFGSYFYDFKIDSQLFIVLTPSVNWMTIVGEQYNFLDSTLNVHQNDVDRVFIFMHELLWWSSTNEYSNIEVNYPPYYPTVPSNWDDLIKPLLTTCDKPVTVYAGDMGCRPEVSPYMFHQFDNITLIGSGLGSYIYDNIVVTEVYEDNVVFKLIAINQDFEGALGELDFFDLTNGMVFPEEFICYPNPAEDFVVFSHNESSELTFEILDLYGNLVEEFVVLPEIRSKIDVNGLRSGVYSVRTTIGDEKRVQQLVIK